MEIGIIGAGASTVGLLDALARLARGPGAVTVFEPSPHRWRGRAFGPDLKSVLVNTPPMIMSARHGDPAHYARWLEDRDASHLDRRLGHQIVPRGMYGDYLEQTAESALARLRELGWRTEVVDERVTGISPSDRPALLTGAGRRHTVDVAVLAVGSGAPQDHYGLSGSPGFVRDPYPLASSLDDLAPERDVAIVGSGLTAVDIVVSLERRGHAGRISLLSRGGVLPAVWQRPVKTELRHLTAGRLTALAREHGELTLGHLRSLLDAELGQDLGELAEEVRATRSEDPVERLRRQLSLIDSPGMGRRVLQQTVHALGPYAWRLLRQADRDVLRDEHFRTIASLSSPMVPGNAAAMLELLDAGQLALVPGVRKIEARAGGFRVFTDAGVRATDVVINAINPPPHSIPESTGALVSSMLADRVAELHPDGGLNVEAATGRLTVSGQADHRLYAVGDLAGGGLFITTSIAGLAARAEATARALLAN
ncbi:FAD/NAD(P)-binding protein [Actinomadura sp. 6N118]|uniref:FAD/NAD(P)-binding protein n=1 Tax=Actinomadura sp. 6N118 TaxID=3375151 RepID=UPI0037A97361